MEWNFKPITAEAADTLPHFYKLRSNKTCDSVFLDSFLWKDYYQVEYSIWEDKAAFLKMEIDGESFAAVPLCKAEDLKECFFELKKYFNEVLGKKLRIYLADEGAVEILDLDPEEFEVVEKPDAADYLYDGEALRKLAGKKYHKKKNHVNGFMKEYEGRYEYKTLSQKEDRGDMWKFLDRWRETKGTQVEGTLDPEVEGIHGILNQSHSLGVRMGGVYVDGQMEAFSMGTLNEAENMAVIHIEKANPDIRGMYAFINQQFLIHEFPDVTLVNREDDVGLPGLRKAKQSYNPIGFAKKYEIKER